jgi:Protein of unknown function (DUF1203)
MSFRFKGLHAEPFSDLIALSDAELESRGMRRMVANAKPGFPCRVTLEDAEPGESLLLLNYEHQPAHSPYRAIGPIFVRETAADPFNGTDVPPVLRSRILSLRAYDKDAMIVEAAVVDGKEVETVLERLFARADTAYVHIHYAARGCFATLVERA